MRLTTPALVGAMVGSAIGFSDTSPFFLFSTARLPALSSRPDAALSLATSQSVQKELASALEDCPSDTYIVVGQPGLSVEDFEASHAFTHLRRRMNGEDGRIRTTYSIAGVVGTVDVSTIVTELGRKCGAATVSLTPQNLPGTKSKVPQVITIDLPEVGSGSDRISELNKQDAYLASVLSSLPTEDFTVMYHSTPAWSKASQTRTGSEQQQVYLMDDAYPSTVHANHFKRDTTAYPAAANGTNLDSNLPLFEKYQFFSSGIFMGLSVSLLLVAILYVGISAIAGLEVSYYAFSKEYNQAAQKKQQ